jgi:hypothetical protein
MSLPETEGGAGVRQAGPACHSDVDGAADAVRSFAVEIRESIDGAGGCSSLAGVQSRRVVPRGARQEVHHPIAIPIRRAV